MIRETTNNNLSFFIGFFLSALAILFFIADFSFPLSGDDLLYQYKFSKQAAEGAPWHISNEKINSIIDLFSSQYYHWWYQNGRIGTHFIVQFFDGLCGKLLYSICTSILYVLTILLLVMFSTSRYEIKEDLYPLIFLTPMLLFLESDPSVIYGCVTGGVGYMWSIFFNLCFALLIKKQNIAKSNYIFFFIVTVFAAWSHEGLVIPIAVSITLYMLHEFKSLSVSKKLMISLYLLICGLMILAPSNIYRFLHNNNQPQPNMIGVIHLLTFKYIRISYILFAALSYKLYKGNLVCFLRNNFYIVIAYVVSFVFILIVGPINSRSVYFIDVFAIIMLLRMLQAHTNRIMRFKRALSITAISFLLFMSSIAYMQYQVGISKRTMYAQLESSQSTICNVIIKKIPYSYPFIYLRLIILPFYEVNNYSWDIICMKYYYQKQEINILFEDI